jgi:hypothetical protein
VGRGAGAFCTTPPMQCAALGQPTNQLFVFLMPMFYASDRIKMKGWLPRWIATSRLFVVIRVINRRMTLRKRL